MKRIVRKTLLVLTCMAIGSGAALADVFKYRDQFGRIVLTDKPLKGLTLLKRYSYSTGRPAPRANRILAEMNRRKVELSPLIDAAANENQLRPALVHAVVRAESAYRADAVSPKGAIGLMQLMPATAERYGVTDPRDPAQNLRGGSSYLRDLLEMFDYDLQLALAAYNAGENAVIKYGKKIPPYRETQDYVRKVIRFFNELDLGRQIALR